MATHKKAFVLSCCRLTIRQNCCSSHSVIGWTIWAGSPEISPTSCAAEQAAAARAALWVPCRPGLVVLQQ